MIFSNQSSQTAIVDDSEQKVQQIVDKEHEHLSVKENRVTQEGYLDLSIDKDKI